MDQKLLERYRSDPRGFARSIGQNLLVVLALLALGAILFYIALKVVGLTGGGLALIAMGLFPVLLALAALDDVRWRRAVIARNGVPPPPPPTLRALLRGRSASKPSSSSASPAGAGEKKLVSDA
jgi:hypothetical protein